MERAGRGPEIRSDNPAPHTQADLPLRYGSSPRSALSGYPPRFVWTPPPHAALDMDLSVTQTWDGAEAEQAAGLEPDPRVSLLRGI